MESRHFALRCRLGRDESHLRMEMRSDVLTTAGIENVVLYLESLFPSVLETRCFNELNLPFRKEVEDTEIGHLFEHIMLEYLCYLTVDSGLVDCCFNGETNWNWHRDPRGVFHIWISAGYGQRVVYYESLRKSTQLMELLLSGVVSSPVGARAHQIYHMVPISAFKH